MFHMKGVGRRGGEGGGERGQGKEEGMEGNLNRVKSSWRVSLGEKVRERRIRIWTLYFWLLIKSTKSTGYHSFKLASVKVGVL